MRINYNKMSSDYRKLQKSRSQKPSHFVQDVTMKPLNDPIPPYHLESPKPVRNDSNSRYFDIDLLSLAPPRGPTVSHRRSEPGPGYSRVVTAPTKAFLHGIEKFEDLPRVLKMSHGELLKLLLAKLRRLLS